MISARALSACASGVHVAAVFLTTGCAPLMAPPYAADYEALDRLEATRPGMVAVAKAQPTDPKTRSTR
jgi:2-hydroxychromene-2-carboxylate isomerase